VIRRRGERGEIGGVRRSDCGEASAGVPRVLSLFVSSLLAPRRAQGWAS
jgi:hypothetical protein